MRVCVKQSAAVVAEVAPGLVVLSRTRVLDQGLTVGRMQSVHPHPRVDRNGVTSEGSFRVDDGSSVGRCRARMSPLCITNDQQAGVFGK